MITKLMIVIVVILFIMGTGLPDPRSAGQKQKTGKAE